MKPIKSFDDYDNMEGTRVLLKPFNVIRNMYEYEEVAGFMAFNNTEAGATYRRRFEMSKALLLQDFFGRMVSFLEYDGDVIIAIPHPTGNIVSLRIPEWFVAGVWENGDPV